MRAWTHWVFCKEIIPYYGPFYCIKASLLTYGTWRCAEKKLAGVRYGQALTGVRIHRKRK